eukprot:gene19482-23338_t
MFSNALESEYSCDRVTKSAILTYLFDNYYAMQVFQESSFYHLLYHGDINLVKHIFGVERDHDRFKDSLTYSRLEFVDFLRDLAIRTTLESFDLSPANTFQYHQIIQFVSDYFQSYRYRSNCFVKLPANYVATSISTLTTTVPEATPAQLGYLVLLDFILTMDLLVYVLDKPAAEGIVKTLVEFKHLDHYTIPWIIDNLPCRYYRPFDLICRFGTLEQVKIAHDLVPIAAPQPKITPFFSTFDIIPFLYGNRRDEYHFHGLSNAGSRSIGDFNKPYQEFLVKHSISNALPETNDPYQIQLDLQQAYKDACLSTIQALSKPSIDRHKFSILLHLDMSSPAAIDIIRWAYPVKKSTIKGNPAIPMRNACLAGNLEVVKFFHSYHPAHMNGFTFDLALLYNQSHVLSFLLANRKEGFGEDAFRVVGNLGDIKVFKMMVQHTPSLTVINQKHLLRYEYGLFIHAAPDYLKFNPLDLTTKDDPLDPRIVEYYLAKHPKPIPTDTIQVLFINALVNKQLQLAQLINDKYNKSATTITLSTAELQHVIYTQYLPSLKLLHSMKLLSTSLLLSREIHEIPSIYQVNDNVLNFLTSLGIPTTSVYTNPYYVNIRRPRPIIDMTRREATIRNVLFFKVCFRSIVTTPLPLVASPQKTHFLLLWHKEEILQQISPPSYRYSDINDANWMIKHGHYSMLADKIRRGEQLLFTQEAIESSCALVTDPALFAAIYSLQPQRFVYSHLLERCYQAANIIAMKFLLDQPDLQLHFPHFMVNRNRSEDHEDYILGQEIPKINFLSRYERFSIPALQSIAIFFAPVGKIRNPAITARVLAKGTPIFMSFSNFNLLSSIKRFPPSSTEVPEIIATNSQCQRFLERNGHDVSLNQDEIATPGYTSQLLWAHFHVDGIEHIKILKRSIDATSLEAVQFIKTHLGDEDEDDLGEGEFGPLEMDNSNRHIIKYLASWDIKYLKMCRAMQSVDLDIARLADGNVTMLHTFSRSLTLDVTHEAMLYIVSSCNVQDFQVPLWYACQQGWTDIVEACFANPKPPKPIVNVPLLAAYGFNRQEIIDIFIKSRPDSIPLDKWFLNYACCWSLAGARKDMEFINKMAEYLDPIAVDSIIKSAMRCGHLSFIKSLLERPGVERPHFSTLMGSKTCHANIVEYWINRYKPKVQDITSLSISFIYNAQVDLLEQFGDVNNIDLTTVSFFRPIPLYVLRYLLESREKITRDELQHIINQLCTRNELFVEEYKFIKSFTAAYNAKQPKSKAKVSVPYRPTRVRRHRLLKCDTGLCECFSPFAKKYFKRCNPNHMKLKTPPTAIGDDDTEVLTDDEEEFMTERAEKKIKSYHYDEFEQGQDDNDELDPEDVDSLDEFDFNFEGDDDDSEEVDDDEDDGVW